MKKHRKKIPEIMTYSIHDKNPVVRKVIPGEYEQYNFEKFTAPHRRDYFSFFLLTSGEIKHSIDFQQYHCRKKDLFYLQPNQVYLVETARKLGGISLIFNPELLPDQGSVLPVIANDFNDNKLSLSPEEFNTIYKIIEAMRVEQQNPDSFSGSLIKSYLDTFVTLISRTYQAKYKNLKPPVNTANTIKSFQQLLNKKWNTDLPVTGYAKALHISGARLNQLLKKHTGRNTIEHIHEKKLLEIKRLLVYSEKSIKVIAYETGFEDPAYFNRFFKNSTGTTPLLFRQQHHQKVP